MRLNEDKIPEHNKSNEIKQFKYTIEDRLLGGKRVVNFTFELVVVSQTSLFWKLITIITIISEIIFVLYQAIISYRVSNIEY